ncbi:RNA polymerase sigma factor, sigma-70 family protein [Janthinobacterium agaricidamnosum NBRC 102515 = DSM 9628]|uniref:RNA polymerase sigma factor n=2 Tax=Janthinobacterium agaricidamnosum TaxID=55508 RepID=W0V5E3_9BURK|nr:RNA polymerase sigma factor, sigma-70 family protein [Janthinobacterium agaricidamnosum NBRC 102515 = DSM 9628]
MLPRLWRFSLRLSRNIADAEDLVQRTCVRALERRAQWHSGTSLISWLYCIAHSVWLNEIRARRLRQHGQLDFSEDWSEQLVDSKSPDPQSLIFFRQVIQEVERLPEAQRTVMLLVAVEGLTYQETAEVLQIPVGTVMSRLARARQSIGEHFTLMDGTQAAAKGTIR